MTTAYSAPRVYTNVIGVVGAASSLGAQLLQHLEQERTDSWLVAITERPLRWPVERITTYRFAQNKFGGILTASDIPDFMQEKAWDMFQEGHEFTFADIPDVLQLEGVNTLIHVGSHYDGPEPERFCSETTRWVQSARLAGVKQFIYLSDIRVYGSRAQNPIPITERMAVNPLSQHRYLADAEPNIERTGDGDPAEMMKTVVLRTAMSAGVSAASPVTDEMLGPAIASNRRRRFPLQFLHENDLVRAVEYALTHELEGVFNLTGDGVIEARELWEICGRAGLGPRGSRELLRDAIGVLLAKHPIIVSSSKFKQAARFKFDYSSARAARAFCHSVLMEPR